MRLSQSAFFQLSLASFIAGLLLSFLYDFLYVTRLWLMPSGIRYTVPTIQRLCGKRIKNRKPKKCTNLRAVIFFQDVLICLVGAITLILLLYWINNGTFRATAPLFLAIGFWLCHSLASKGARIALQWLAFGIETILYTLLMPFKRLFGWAARVCKANAQKRHLSRLAKERQNYTRRELQNIDGAIKKLLSIPVKSRTQKGERRARKNKKSI